MNFEVRDFDHTGLYRFHQALDGGDPALGSGSDEEGEPFESLDDVPDQDPIADYVENGDCLRLGSDYNNPIDLSQTAHFDPWKSYKSSMSVSNPVCRSDDRTSTSIPGRTT